MQDPGSQFVERLDAQAIEALVQTMALVAFADGRYTAAEREQFCASVAELSGGRHQADDFEPLLAEVLRRLDAGERDQIVGQIAAVLTGVELGSVALILACDMAAADGVLHPAEHRLLLQLSEALGVEDSAIADIVDSMPRAAAPGAAELSMC